MHFLHLRKTDLITFLHLLLTICPNVRRTVYTIFQKKNLLQNEISKSQSNGFLSLRVFEEKNIGKTSGQY